MKKYHPNKSNKAAAKNLVQISKPAKVDAFAKEPKNSVKPPGGNMTLMTGE